MAEFSFISVDDHVQEPPDLWTKRLPRSKWNERIPHIETDAAGEHWVVDGGKLKFSGAADCGALTPDRAESPQRWSEVPPSVYDPRERLKAMDAAGVAYSVLYPTIAGSDRGPNRRHRRHPDRK